MKFRAESILAQKMTRLRMSLAARLTDPKATFTKEEFEIFADHLGRCCPGSAFEAELEVVRGAITNRKLAQPPDLSLPELQLLWGAALLHMKRSAVIKNHMMPIAQKVNLQTTELWKQILETAQARQTLYNHATYIGEELRRKDTRFTWGLPGSGIVYDPESKSIGIDFAGGLIDGLEHTHAMMIREIGKHHLSTAIPDKSRAVRDQIRKFKVKEKAGTLSSEEYKTMRRLGLEWEMRRMLGEAAEKCMLNRYTERKGQEKAQDYAYSLNHALMTGTPFGRIALNSLRTGIPGFPADENSPEFRFVNIVHAIELSFFRNNALFSNTARDWRMFGVRPELVRITKKDFERKQAQGGMRRGGFPPPDFGYLLDLCGGPEGLENLQPRSRDRWNGKAYFRNLIEHFTRRRNAVIEKIWDLYVEDLYLKMARDLEEQLDDKLGNDKGEKQDGPQGGEGEGEGQDGEDQDGDPSQGSPSSQGGQSKKKQQSGQQKPQKGNPQQGGQSGGQDQSGEPGESGQQGPSDPQDGEDEDADGQEGDPSAANDDAPDQEGGEDGAAGPQDFGSDDEPSTGDGKDQSAGQEFDPEKAGLDKEGKEVHVENDKGATKKMPDVETPSEQPGEQSADQENGQNQGKDGKPKDGSEGKTLEQIKKEMEEAQKKAREQAEKAQQGQKPQNGDGKGQPGKEKGQGQGTPGQDKSKGDDEADSPFAGDGGRPKTLAEIASMEWTSYAELLAHLKSYVAQTASLLEKIRERQVERTLRRSFNLEMLPENREMDRLDEEAHKSYRTKLKTGQPLAKEDLNRFRKDETHLKPTTIDVVLLIDGSGSMTMNGYEIGGVKPMEIALLSSIILYEAAKAVDANVYIVLWGNDDPIVLARPGDDPRTVEKNILMAKKGMNCGTNLEPSIRKITKVLADQKSSEYSGYTHMMVLSDGDISDLEKAEDAINTLLSMNAYTTIDFAIMKEGNAFNTQMEVLAKHIKTANPTQNIGVHRDGNPNSVPAGILGLIFQKIRAVESFAAVPWEKKRKLFQQVFVKLGMK